MGLTVVNSLVLISPKKKIKEIGLDKAGHSKLWSR